MNPAVPAPEQRQKEKRTQKQIVSVCPDGRRPISLFPRGAPRLRQSQRNLKIVRIKYKTRRRGCQVNKALNLGFIALFSAVFSEAEASSAQSSTEAPEETSFQAPEENESQENETKPAAPVP